MAKFKNISGEQLHLGRPDGRAIDAGEVIDAGGEVDDELDDAWIVGEGDDARAWPKATWELVDQAAKSGKSGKESN